MKKLCALLIALVCAPALANYWDNVPFYKTTLTPDAATAASYTGSENGYYTMQCTGAFYAAAGASVASTTGRHYAASPDGVAYFRLHGQNNKFAVISASGSISCLIFYHGSK